MTPNISATVLRARIAELERSIEGAAVDAAQARAHAVFLDAQVTVFRREIDQHAAAVAFIESQQGHPAFGGDGE